MMMTDAELLGLHEEERLSAKIHHKWASDHNLERARRRYRPKKRNEIRIFKNDRRDIPDTCDYATVMFDSKPVTADVEWVVITAEPEPPRGSSFWSWLGF